jgi:hypothetical protein
MAGDAVRDRLGDAGLLASDLPDAIPAARKRLVGVADRLRPGKRLGFAVREPAGSAGSSGPAEGHRSTHASRQPACRPCRERPGWRSIWTPCGESRGGSRTRRPRRAGEPVVKADAYGHGAIPLR